MNLILCLGSPLPLQVALKCWVLQVVQFCSRDFSSELLPWCFQFQWQVYKSFLLGKGYHSIELEKFSQYFEKIRMSAHACNVLSVSMLDNVFCPLFSQAVLDNLWGMRYSKRKYFFLITHDCLFWKALWHLWLDKSGHIWGVLFSSSKDQLLYSAFSTEPLSQRSSS